MGVLVVVLTSVIVPTLGVLAPADATTRETTPPSPTATQVQSAQAKAAAVEAQITADSQREQIASETYDEAAVSLGRDQAKVAVDEHRLALQAAAVRFARAKVQSAAVAAYVYGDSADAQFGAVISSNIVEAGTISAYAGVATSDLGRTVTSLQSAQSRLRASTVTEIAAVRSASLAVTHASVSKAAAAHASAAASAELHAVQGQIATLVAEQEAAAAAAAEARARAAAAAAARAKAAAQARARAQALAAQQKAEAQASVAASVATAVSSSDPSNATLTDAAASATNSAAAASSAGEPPLQPAGTNPAGLVAVQSAESYLGVPYVWGGASMNGVDCSGLTMLAWGQAGVSLLHSAWFQYGESTHISLSQIEPGDLLFYWFPGDGGDPVTHVAMYVGSGPYGTQTLIQAPETGEDVSYAPMYYYGLVGAARP